MTFLRNGAARLPSISAADDAADYSTRRTEMLLSFRH